MISLMVVDDEELILKGIRSILKRDSHGYIMVGEAGNGIEAIETARKVKPELIITDICMPEMNGLEMVKQIREFLPDTKFIILSGYGEFEYAQEAVRLGVIDYLLKPINSSGLYTVLDKVKGQLMKDENRRTVERDNLLEKLLGGYIFNREDRCLKQLTEILGEQSNYRLEIVTLQEKMNQQEADRIREWITGYMRKGDYGYVLGVENGFLLIFQDKEEREVNRVNDAVLNQMKQIFNYRFQIDMAGDPVALSEIRKGYQRAVISLKMRFYMEDECDVQRFDGTELYPLSVDMIYEDITQELLTELEAGRDQKAVEMMKKLVREFEKKHIEPKDLTRYLQGIIRICISQLQLKGYLRGSLQGIMDETISHINYCTSEKELMQNCRIIVSELVEMMEDQSGPTASRTVMEVKRYILQNYQKDIGLNEVAEEVFLNPKYLSDLFKRETGQTFMNYLTEVRMENAKQALRRVDLKIYEVAESVGYHNPRNFVKMFKKYSGITPMEYRNQLL